jgi:hypothetical protein
MKRARPEKRKGCAVARSRPFGRDDGSVLLGGTGRRDLMP